jgi:hypothetical protein
MVEVATLNPAVIGQTRTEATPASSSLQHKPAVFPCRNLSHEEAIAWRWDVRWIPPGDEFVYTLLRWRVDPILFAIECLRVVLQRYQAQILLDLADAPAEIYAFYGLDPSHPKRQVLVPSGHGLGKTRVLAIAIWWHVITHAFSKTLCTAPTSGQLTGQLWGEIRKMQRRMRKHWPDLANDWEVLGSSINHVNPDYADWHVLARTARPEKPEGLQGAHGMDIDDEFNQLAEIFQDEIEHSSKGGILVVIEEASGVDDQIRETLEGALSEEGARLLAPGNVTRPDGWFAEDLDKRNRYAVHELDCRMSDRTKTYMLPYRDMQGRVHQLKMRGFVRPQYWLDILADVDGDEDADRFRVRVRGMKPRSAVEQCIKTHWVEQAIGREPDKASEAEVAIIGLDFGLTSDKHALAVCKGFNIREVDEWLPKDKPDEVTLDAARRAIDAQEIYKAKYIIGDSNGVGRGAMEYLSRYYRERPELNVLVIHFNSGAGAADSSRYYRRRDEMWYREGRRFFSDPRCSLPNVPGLKTQLITPGFHEDTSRRIQVETKDEIRKRTGQPSGNAADAILQTRMVRVVVEKPKEETKPFHPKIFVEHFKRWTNKHNGYNDQFIR